MPIKETSTDLTNEPVHHYSRESRLSHASPEVRAMNENHGNVKRGILASIFGSRPNAVLFACILLAFMAFIVFSRPPRETSGLILGNNTLHFEVLHEENINILAIRKISPQSGEMYIGPVDIIVRPGGEDQSSDLIFSHRIFFNPIDSENFLLTLPFSGDDFFVGLNNGSEEKAIRLR